MSLGTFRGSCEISAIAVLEFALGDCILLWRLVLAGPRLPGSSELLSVALTAHVTDEIKLAVEVTVPKINTGLDKKHEN